MFMKNPDAVIGPGDTVVLPKITEPWMFMHEAELAVVIAGPAKGVDPADWRSYVFGYTALIDVSARGDGRVTWKRGGWLGKSFDTFCPLGPCITTADEVPDPNSLAVRFWDDGQLRHDYNTNDMEHDVSEILAFASSIMTLYSGDVLACGTNHEGLGPIQNGERLRIEIERIGAMDLDVIDPLERSWPRGTYLGADSTNKQARKRYAAG
jgi:2-keto-4-pentenoate hydratase/2-oxohepta-3-ene-1,7-dioic acid hydratase in catechol pathway